MCAIGNLQHLSLARGAGERRIRGFHADVNLAAQKAQALIAHHRAGKQSRFEQNLKTVADAQDQAARARETYRQHFITGEKRAIAPVRR